LQFDFAFSTSNFQLSFYEIRFTLHGIRNPVPNILNIPPLTTYRLTTRRSLLTVHHWPFTNHSLRDHLRKGVEKATQEARILANFHKFLLISSADFRGHCVFD